MKQNLPNRLIIFPVSLFCVIVLNSFNPKNTGIRNEQKNYDTIITSKLPGLPGQMSFAGEMVPLERWEIKEQLEREFILISYETGTMLYVMKLATRWFPLIEERLKANGI